MNKKILMAMLLTYALLAANNATATQILGLDIGGTQYDVTFHQAPATFDSLWGNDPTYTTWNGAIGRAPMFWGDTSGALQAGQAIITHLGTTGVTLAPFDSFFVPTSPGDALNIYATSDLYPEPDSDLLYPPDIVPRTLTLLTHPWASFALTESGSAPAPITPALMLVGLVAVAVVRRTRRAV